MKKAFIITGLGYGDEGKGTSTDWLSHTHKAHTVVRVGGPQALHHVVKENGKSHVFSQFGSGTFEGAGTHLSKDMLIDPHAILSEGEALERESYVSDIFDMMTIHEDALVITPFQAIAGRVRELIRGKNNRGSVGIGVGETVTDSEIIGSRAIRAKDLAKPNLREKLIAMQKYKWSEFEELADRSSNLPIEIKTRVQSELQQMDDPDTIEWAIERFGELVKRVKIVDTEFVAKKILGKNGTTIFENSQGVLLDRYCGFHPYTTKVRTIPSSAKNIIKECDYDGEVESLGVLRAYHTRHGKGPFVSESKELTERFPDEVNKNHKWQGNFRVGHFDLLAAGYAIRSCGGDIDALILTCVDRLMPESSWKVCTAYECDFLYEHGNRNSYFQIDPSGDITDIKSRKADKRYLGIQENLGKYLEKCVPKFRTYDISSYRLRDIISLCVGTLEEALNLRVKTVSIGQTEKQKIEKIKR